MISAIGGTAGVGKTALAVHWAHQVAGRFPDGQLYVNLRGYDPGQPMPAADALAGFLRALACPARTSRPEEDERAARYRSLLAGRRMLVVLDNAGSAEQVRPLLPGTPACVVVVTSRDALAGLVARDGAARLDLDLLPLADAVGLLRALIGARADADPARPRRWPASAAGCRWRCGWRPSWPPPARPCRWPTLAERAGRPAAAAGPARCRRGPAGPRCGRCSPGPTGTWTPTPPGRSGCSACTPALTSSRYAAAALTGTTAGAGRPGCWPRWPART